MKSSLITSWSNWMSCLFLMRGNMELLNLWIICWLLYSLALTVSCCHQDFNLSSFSLIRRERNLSWTDNAFLQTTSWAIIHGSTPSQSRCPFRSSSARARIQSSKVPWLRISSIERVEIYGATLSPITKREKDTVGLVCKELKFSFPPYFLQKRFCPWNLLLRQREKYQGIEQNWPPDLHCWKH